MALDPVAQQLDFSLGMFRAGALEREPATAAETVVGLIGDDGLPFKRGGSVYKSNATLDGSLLWVADATLVGGRRTMIGSPSHFGVLDVDDASPLALLTQAFSGPRRVAVVQGAAFVGAGPTMYGGSRKPASYGPVAVTLTNGSKTVTGAGLSFLANVDAGMLLHEDTGAHSLGVVDSVASDTALSLRWPWPGANAAATATFYAGANLSNSSTVDALTPAGVASTIFASVANRLVVAFGNRVAFSEVGDPTMFAASDYHLFPATVVALGTLRDVLLVFTQAGVYAVSNLAYPLVDPATGDPQQRKEIVNADMVAWGHEGIAPWAGSLIVPCLDGIYLMDSIGAPTAIHQRIADLYLSYVRAGYRPGVGEVYNGHYFLPVLDGSNNWVDSLVCRLLPTHSSVQYGWSQVTGAVAAFAERQASTPVLLGASRAGRVLDLSSFFIPGGAVKSDADGSAPGFTLSTIDYPTGNSVSNFVHHVRVRYALAGTGSMTAEVSVDGGAYTALAGTVDASATEGRWRVNAHARNVRFRFSTAAAVDSLTVKSVEVFVRHSGRQ